MKMPTASAAATLASVNTITKLRMVPPSGRGLLGRAGAGNSGAGEGDGIEFMRHCFGRRVGARNSTICPGFPSIGLAPLSARKMVGAPPKMARRRSPDLFDLVPPIAGLALLGVFFVPGFSQLLGSLFLVAVIVLVLTIVGLIGWKLLRKSQAKDTKQNQPLTPSAVTQATVPEWSIELLRKLEWKRFEEIVAAYIRELGQTARTTRIGPDGGVDVEVLDPSTNRVVMLVQCKAWVTYKVGIKPVRELFGVMAAAKVAEGAFFTTGEFTHEARAFGQEHNLDLIDGVELMTRVGQLPQAGRQNLLRVATDGDYTTPTCPSCDVKMVLRTASKGRSEGQEFWGCQNYPRCRQTFRL